MTLEETGGSNFLAQLVSKDFKTQQCFESTILLLGIYPKEMSDPWAKLNEQECLSQLSL
jgi:hypothetical protein